MYHVCLLQGKSNYVHTYGEKYVKWFTFEHLNWDLCNYPWALEKNKAKYFDISVLVWLSAVPHIRILIKKKPMVQQNPTCWETAQITVLVCFTCASVQTGWKKKAQLTTYNSLKMWKYSSCRWMTWYVVRQQRVDYFYFIFLREKKCHKNTNKKRHNWN